MNDEVNSEKQEEYIKSSRWWFCSIDRCFRRFGVTLSKRHRRLSASSFLHSSFLVDRRKSALSVLREEKLSSLFSREKKKGKINKSNDRGYCFGGFQGEEVFSRRSRRRKDVRCRADVSRRTSRGDRRGSDEKAAWIEAYAPERGTLEIRWKNSRVCPTEIRATAETVESLEIALVTSAFTEIIQR